MSELFEINVRSSIKPYSVKIGYGFVKEWIQSQDCILIVDQNVLELYPWLNRESIIKIIAKEENKTFDSIATSIELMRGFRANRNSHIVAIGGGITQDLATFVASSYMRGVNWSYCATTLLGMADSCIGGKSSINVGKYKNIAGNFYPPELVLIDTSFCETLTNEQKIEGLLEAIKICFASRNDSFDRYLLYAIEGDLLKDNHLVSKLIALSIQTKKEFIEVDEFDQGVRLLLNFGHTFGHAIESATDYQISHGVAVGLGMFSALVFSIEMGWVDSNHSRLLALKENVLNMLKLVPRLTENLELLIIEDAVDKFRSDKKHKSGEYAIIGLNQDGYLERRFVPINDYVEKQIGLAFESIKRII